MARCSIQVLGGFAVSVDGRPVGPDAWRNRRAADVVKLLALTPGHTLHREQVMAALWPDLGPAAAGANLRKALHFARRALGSEQAISSAAGQLSLWAGEVTVDASVFLATAAEALGTGDPASCARAADRYGGDAVPADRYEPWAAEPRQRLRKRYLAVLTAAGQWDRVLDLDPTEERAHRALMAGHLAAGRRREAIRQFERLRTALRERIGVGPDPQTIALYQEVLDLETEQPPEVGPQAAMLIAMGLVHFNRREFAAAEQLARQAQELAVAAGLPHEVGDASTLLALVASRTGRWPEVFRAEFTAALALGDELGVATYDANLCFAEYHVSASAPVLDSHAYATDLLTLADVAESAAGRGMAQLLLGEALLLAGAFDRARRQLTEAVDTNRAAQAMSGVCVCLERLAQAEIALSRPRQAAVTIARAHAIARTSPMRSHLLVRVLGVAITTPTDPGRALLALTRAERELAGASRVCEPCAMHYHVQAARISAQAGEVYRAHQHLGDADRIAGLWQNAPWTAAVWEARAAVRKAEGHPGQAAALLHEAAAAYAQAGRPADEQRCRAAAG